MARLELVCNRVGKRDRAAAVLKVKFTPRELTQKFVVQKGRRCCCWTNFSFLSSHWSNSQSPIKLSKELCAAKEELVHDIIERCRSVLSLHSHLKHRPFVEHYKYTNISLLKYQSQIHVCFSPARVDRQASWYGSRRRSRCFLCLSSFWSSRAIHHLAEAGG